MPLPTVKQIQQRLIADQHRRALVIPNYTPRGWFECDLFELTKSGCFREYEIKMTRADFLNDAKKAATEWKEVKDEATGRFRFNRSRGPTKHKRLASRDTIGPKQFFFVCPPGVIGIDDLPEFAGLIHCSIPDKYPRNPPHTVIARIIQPAPVLHKAKADNGIGDHARGICYWRFVNLFMYGKPSFPTNETTEL